MTDQPIQPTQPTAIVSLSNLPKGMTKAQLINPGSGKKYERIWRLEPGQPTDPKNRAASGQFYITRKVRDPQDRTKKIDEYSLGLGTEPKVIPLGYGLSRDYTVFHNDTKMYEQYCHSDNFFTPDVRFLGETIKGSGVIAHRCCEVRKKVSKKTGEPILDDNGNEQFYYHKLCPFANFTAPSVEGGKNQKPKCDAVYTVYFAIKAKFVDPQDKTKVIEKWVAAEIAMKVMQATMGEAIIGMFGEMEKAETPLSTFPLQFGLSEYIQSGAIKNSFVARLLTAEKVDQGSISPEEFEACSTVVADTIAGRKKWSQYDPNEDKEDNEPQPIAAAPVAPPTQPTVGKEITVNAAPPTATPDKEAVLLF